MRNAKCEMHAFFLSSASATGIRIQRVESVKFMYFDSCFRNGTPCNNILSAEHYIYLIYKECGRWECNVFCIHIWFGIKLIDCIVKLIFLLT